MAIEKQEIQKSQMGTWQRLDHRRKSDDLNSPTNNSSGSLPSTDAIIIIDDDDDEVQTLEPENHKNKKPRFGFWWDDVEAFNELSCVVKGLPKVKQKNDVSSCFSSTDLHEKKKDVERSISTHHAFVDSCDDESVSESTGGTSKGNEDRVGFRHVSLDDLGVSVEDLKNMPWDAFDPTWEIRSVAMDPWLGGYIQDLSPF